MGSPLNGRTHANEPKWESATGVCKYVSLEEKHGMDWDSELLWEGFKSW